MFVMITMLNDYKKILDQSIILRNENKKFFEWLKKWQPKDLDKTTNKLHDKAFESIDCLQCANCCATTGPLIRNKDVEQLAKGLKIRPAVFVDKYLRIDEDNDFVFKSMPCPFLGSDKYCNVYENRPNACKDYPHTQQNKIYTKLNITFLNSMICPAVATVTEGLKKHYQK